MRRRAFTFVEVLVVLGIVATLAGIAFSTFVAVKRRAEHTSCAERLHQLGTAIALYANDHDGWVPPHTTAEKEFEAAPGVTPAILRRSPALFVADMDTYVRNSEVWFCPVDPQRGKETMWLGQRHRWTSYFFLPRSDGDRLQWPPRMQLGRDRLSNAPPEGEDMPLLCDAAGVPSHDSDPQFGDNPKARSNHPDDLVNAIRHDLSLSRRPAREWLGTNE